MLIFWSCSHIQLPPCRKGDGDDVRDDYKDHEDPDNHVGHDGQAMMTVKAIENECKRDNK